MTGNVAYDIDKRTARINDEIRERRLKWVDHTLQQIAEAKRQAIERLPWSKSQPEFGLIILRNSADGTEDCRHVCRLNPIKSRWIMDDHGQLYMYGWGVAAGKNQPIPYSHPALRDWSMQRFDDSLSSIPKTAFDVHDSQLEDMLRDIRRLGA